MTTQRLDEWSAAAADDLLAELSSVGTEIEARAAYLQWWLLGVCDEIDDQGVVHVIPPPREEQRP